jgi:hypothetical protein
MVVKLFSRTTGGFVAVAEIPPFNEPPDVIIYGARFFVAPKVDMAVRLAELSAGEVAYVEAFTYAIPRERR